MALVVSDDLKLTYLTITLFQFHTMVTIACNNVTPDNDVL